MNKEMYIKQRNELIEKGQKLINEGDKRFIESPIDNEKMSIMLFTNYQINIF